MDIDNYPSITLLATFIIALGITWYAIPVLIRISYEKGFLDVPDSGRKLHERLTSNLGGIAIFSSIFFTYSLMMWREPLVGFGFFASALLILFTLGLKDDISAVSPRKKMAGQLIAVGLVVFSGVRLTSLCGLFGIHEFPVFISVILSIVVFIALINAFNLIDGVDGLAGTVGLISSGMLALWFGYNGYMPLALLSVALAGSLIAFLVYNLEPARIFMGDSGSLVIGFLLAYLTISFIELNVANAGTAAHYAASPVIAVALLFIPIFDTLRVMMIRLINRRPIFKPDRSHIHHYLKDMGLNDTMVVLILACINAAAVFIALAMHSISLHISLFTLLLFAVSANVAGVVFRKHIVQSQVEVVFHRKRRGKSDVVLKEAHARHRQESFDSNGN